jgi:uncharacterized protein YqeY
MPTITELNAAIADAMRARNQTTLDALRMLKTALTMRAVEKGRDLDDAESQQVVSTLVKQRRDSIEQFTAAGRDELARKEAAEIVPSSSATCRPAPRTRRSRLPSRQPSRRRVPRARRTSAR